MSLYVRCINSIHLKEQHQSLHLFTVLCSRNLSIRTTNFSTAINSPGFSPKMKLQVLVAATLTAMAMAHHPPGVKEKCGRLGVKEWDPDNLPEGYKLEDIKKCAEYPLEVGYYWGFGEH
ncbi:hypothetical protein CDV36_000679 [Fusarium kuroshium]|uniref:Uncharacterized protein n=1 Tax=Fusarium kuroshium TaxID=2010991 RepID=A0A3M2SQ30_9HYPO|nr:hypothetical protein CDV36_000679 [Fusarium kuroshium]